jgi:hypothetical protein
MATPHKGLFTLAAISCALALAGCASHVAERDVAPHATSTAVPALQRHAGIRKLRALLTPRSPPDCEYQATDAATTLDPEILARLKLDYERDCYERAETSVRDQLRQLQGQVSGSSGIQPTRHHLRSTR